MSKCFDCEKFLLTKKRKIGEIEKMEDLESEMNSLLTKKHNTKLYELNQWKIMPNKHLYFGKFLVNLNLEKIFEFIEINNKSKIISIENQNCFRNCDLRLVKKEPSKSKATIIIINILSNIIKLEIHQTMKFFIKNCTDYSLAVDVIEIFCFELKNHKYSNLFFKT